MNPTFQRILYSIRLYALLLAVFIFSSPALSEEVPAKDSQRQTDFLSIDGKIPEFFQKLDLQKLKQESGIKYVKSKDDLKHFHYHWYIDEEKRTWANSWIGEAGQFFSETEGQKTFIKGSRLYVDNHDERFDEYDKYWTKIYSFNRIGIFEKNSVCSSYKHDFYTFPNNTLSFYQKKQGLILLSSLYRNSDACHYVFDEKTGVLICRHSFTSEGTPQNTLNIDFSPIPATRFDNTPEDIYKEAKMKLVFSGTVCNEKNTPVPHCSVLVEGFTSYSKFETRTKSDGKFEIFLPENTLKPGFWTPIQVKAYSEKHPESLAWAVICTSNTQEHFEGNFNALFADLVTDHHGKIEENYHGFNEENKKRYNYYHIIGCTDMKLVMQKTGSIKGKVTDASGQPLAGAEVWLHSFKSDYALKYEDFRESLDKGTEEFSLYPDSFARTINANGSIHKMLILKAGDLPAWKVKTDNEGHYEIKLLPTGKVPRIFFVYCDADNYAMERKILPFAENQESGKADFKLYRRELVVRGKLMDDSGEPIPYYPVILARGKNHLNRLGGYTDEDGNFTILKAPDYPDLNVALPDARVFERLWNYEKVDTVYVPVYAPVNVRQGQKEYNVTLTAKPPKLTVKIIVRDENEEPMQNCEVCLSSKLIFPGFGKEKNLFAALTDKKGVCRFERVPGYANRPIRFKVNVTNMDYMRLPEETFKEEKKLRAQKYIGGVSSFITPDENGAVTPVQCTINFTQKYKQMLKYPTGDPDIF